MLSLTRKTAERTPLNLNPVKPIPIGYIPAQKIDKVPGYNGVLVLVDDVEKIEWTLPYEDMFENLFIRLENLPKINLI